MKEFINLHQHTYFSNANMMEVVSGVDDYIKLSQEHGYKTMCITDHGNVLNWVSKMETAQKAGMKYIHGVEAYITDNIEEKIRDNYHLILLAKNYDGAQEINRLVSTSFEGKGNKDNPKPHFYYNPRITFDELKNTSDNILILTSCLGSPIWQYYKSNQKEKLSEWIEFVKENKDRVWLEVQPHNHPEQKKYNELLLGLHNNFDIRIVATNDVHAHSKRADSNRKILMKAKNIRFEDDTETDFELWWKNYDEMFDSFKLQGVLTDSEITEVLDETVKISDLVEEFTLDKHAKYPRIFGDSQSKIQHLVLDGYKDRGLDLLDKSKQSKYQDRVIHELNIMKQVDAIDYMLLEQHIKEEMRKEDRHPGAGRGSVAGSLVAYLLRITDVDPIKENLLFSRFINPDRISMQDVDSDWYEDDRERVQEFLLTHNKLHCASIVTYGTLGVKSAFKEVARGLGLPYDEVNQASKEFIEDGGQTIIPDFIKTKYPEVCQIAEEVGGVVTNVGRHAAGVIVSDRDLESEIGTIEVKDFKYPVSMIDMSGVEGLKYVKLDVLGLKNIGWIHRATELAGIERIAPDVDYADFNDWAVAESIANDNAAIFQFESDRTGKVVKEIFSETSLNRIKQFNPDITVVELLSVATAVIRPGAVSIVEDVMQGKPKDNGYEALNAIMADSFGYMVYQEQQIKFLTEFAGMSGSEADTIRRAISKKKRDVMEYEVPIIKEKFIKNMMDRYGDAREKIEPIADEFMEIFISSAQYSFNKSHSVAYSYISFETAWLRTYYPLEYITAGLQIWNNNLEKTNRLITYAKTRNITIEQPKFRYSRGDYFFDKETNTIYQGTAPIKDNNAQTGDMLYSLRKGRYNNFVDFLVMLRENTTLTTKDKTFTILDLLNMSEDDVKQLDKDIKLNDKNGGDEFVIETSSLSINKTKMLSLIRLNYFREFGKNEKLEKVFDAFNTSYKPKNKTYSGKHKKYVELTELEKTLEDTRLPLFDQCSWELYYKGKISVIDDSIPPQYAFVTEINKGKTRTSATVYNINKGVNAPIKVGAKLYRNINFDVGDMVQILKTKSIAKSVKVDGVWGKHPTEKELWIEDMKSIRKGIQK